MRHERLEALKWAALAAMAVDHAGLLFGGPEWLRLVGRLALPGFLWVLAARLAMGGSPERVGLRLAAWAVVAQVPFTLAFGGHHVNVLGTLAAGVAFASGHPAAMAAAVGLVPFVEYPAAALGLPLLVQLLRGGHRHAGGLLLVGVVVVAHLAEGLPLWAAAAAGWAAVVVWLPAPAVGRLRPGWAFYAFYPVHLAVLGLLARAGL